LDVETIFTKKVQGKTSSSFFTLFLLVDFQLMSGPGVPLCLLLLAALSSAGVTNGLMKKDVMKTVLKLESTKQTGAVSVNKDLAQQESKKVQSPPPTKRHIRKFDFGKFFLIDKAFDTTGLRCIDLCPTNGSNKVAYWFLMAKQATRRLFSQRIPVALFINDSHTLTLQGSIVTLCYTPL